MKLYRIDKNAVLLPDETTALPGAVVGMDKLPQSQEWLDNAIAEERIVEVKSPADLPPTTEPPPPPPTKVEEKWSFNPDALSQCSLEELNAIIEEHRGEEPVEPAPTKEEAIAFLSQNFVPE